MSSTRPSVTDGKIVTSRKPDDVEAFTNALIEVVEEMPEVEEIRNRANCQPNRVESICAY